MVPIMKKLLIPILILFFLNTLTFAQLIVKDQDATPHTLLQVNDEGVAGSITLNQLSTIGTATSKLYNLGGVLYWAGSPLATGGSSPWIVNGSNIYYTAGNVGIGLTAPLDKLHLSGDFRIDDASPYIQFYSGTTQMGSIGFWTDNNLNIINRGATSPIVFATNAAEKMRITAEGNVGIGTSNPLDKLDISGGSIRLENLHGLSLKASNGYTNYVKSVANDLHISNLASGKIFLLTGADIGSGYTRMIIDKDGNVGVGTTTPFSKLSVGGNGNLDYTIYGETDIGTGVYGYASNSGNVTNYGGYFEAEGVYGRGVHGKSIGNYALGVSGYALGIEGRGIYGEAAGSTGIGVYGRSDGPYGRGVVGDGNDYDFDAVGSGVNYGSTSSIRWKRNIIEIDEPLDKLAKLRGVYFDWDSEHGGGHDVGMIAEEVGKVLPEIVVYEENGIDADGMDYSKLTPLLVEAVKAQQKMIEDLQKEVQLLKTK